MKTTGAVLKYVGPVSDAFPAGAAVFMTTLELPNGKKLTIEFKKSNQLEATVPTTVTYLDALRNKQVVFHENYARAILESYGPTAVNKENRVLAFVREIKEEEINIPVFDKFVEPVKVEPVVEAKVEAPIPEPTPPVVPEKPVSKFTRKKKEHEKETVS